MSSAAHLRALVLNADFRPLSTWPLSVISAQAAIGALFRDRVTVVEEWDAVLHSPSLEIRVPKVVALRHFAPVSAAPKFCRRSLLLRDHYTCQYCGHPFPANELTFDHVIPRERGGKTEWTNILMACVECNKRKRNSLPQYNARKGHPLRPLKPPRQPTTAELLRAGLEFLDDETKATWGDWLYYDAELLP